MDSLEQRLRDAARQGDLKALRKCLAAGADVDAGSEEGYTPLVYAVRYRLSGCVATLLAAAADPDAADGYGWTALHHATYEGCEVSMPALLAAGASPTAVVPRSATTPLHWAAAHGSTAAVALLLRAAPATAACRDMHGKTPLALALACQRAAAARCLMEHAPLPPAGELLPAMSSFGDAMQPLYATLAARQPLSTGQWALVPSPCAGLGAALPAVLQRSTVEASLLVRRLPPADRGRLHTFALCLARAQRRRRKRRRPRLPPLPTPILWRLLALSLTE
ncbi:ankyrin repeat PH and SEC7 domain containing [Micractinium conductrix]|uniref:Ankyrin repeat PH and SEC7 domain containing n=1 Tax=Micractinium conductrix TaxID=554055 RepID=A0A2P6V3V2_9CHLO|nr:ankyrin repeat PH and SEC7 domain containing [Micractinium conductrix]|eukprot:PSC68771.1 ankyrin repeat PH and SEC7 domain containing [Micractinium conductrix]